VINSLLELTDPIRSSNVASAVSTMLQQLSTVSLDKLKTPKSPDTMLELKDRTAAPLVPNTLLPAILKPLYIAPMAQMNDYYKIMFHIVLYRLTRSAILRTLLAVCNNVPRATDAIAHPLPAPDSDIIPLLVCGAPFL
jgi:hypothetical protein